MSAAVSNALRGPGDGGQGYCYDFDRQLFAGSEGLVDGPLLIALDSNVLFDLEELGRHLIDDDLPSPVGGERGMQLEALGRLLEAWFMRDIRFAVVPATRDDFKKSPPESRLRERERLFSSIEQALTFQLDDWGNEAERHVPWRESDEEVDYALARVPDHLDRLMIQSAWECGSDVFLTMDTRLLAAMRTVPSGFPNVWSPAQLVSRLLDSDSGSDAARHWLMSGTISHVDCRWAGGLPFGDTGKWVRLFEAFQ